MGTVDPPTEPLAGEHERDSLGALFLRFLKFGCLAFGGPVAQIHMIKAECVDEEKWITQEAFRRLLGVYQVMPGPEAHELCVYLGTLRRGKVGGVLAGLGFMLPGFLLMLGLSALYVEGVLDGFDAVFYGLKPIVAALVVAAVIRLARNVIDDRALVLIAVTAFVVTLWRPGAFALVLAGAGLANWSWRARPPTTSTLAFVPEAGLAVVAALGVLASVAAFVPDTLVSGLKTGSLTFGGAYTAIPFLQHDAVTVHGWLTTAEFLDGIAIGSVLPAPLIIFSTFVGYVASGLGGAFAMTAGIFLPAFLLPILLHERLVAITGNPRARAFLAGVTGGVIGLIAAVAIDVGRAGLVDAPTAVIAVIALVVMIRSRSKLTVLYLVGAGAAAGVLVQALGV